MARFKVVNVDPLSRRVEVETEIFVAADIDFVAQRCGSDDEVVAVAHDADALLCTIYPIGAEVLKRCPDVKVIVRYGVGVDNVDLDAATAAGVVVCNVPDYCIDEVANHTMALLLACNRRIVAHNAAVRTGEKAALAPMGPLRGETLGLIGLGRLAQAVASRARAFGLKVIAYDPFVTADPEGATTLVTLTELLSRCDYLSIHVPLTAATQGLIGEAELSIMKPTAYVVSTARGGIVSEVALHQALAAGLIAGAGLDVWEREPVTSANPLLEFSQVIATGHMAYFSDVSSVTLRRRVAEITVEALERTVPASVVNPAVVK